MMYAINLTLHSWTRWGIVVLLLVALVRSVRGWRGQVPWTARDERIGRALIGLVDTQLLLGIGLWLWTSPLPKAAFAAGFRHVFESAPLWFFGFAHPLGMTLGIFVLHAGHAFSEREHGAARHKPLALGILAFLVVVAVVVPWPGPAWGRPLFRISAR